MDPITGAFASIIGLICNYRSEVSSRNSESFEEFVEWLSEHRHFELKSLIESNHKTSISVKALLSQNSSLFLSRFDELDKILASISSKIDGLDSLAESIHPSARLSSQSIEILSNLYQSGSSNFYIQGSSVDQPPIIDFRSGSGMRCDEPQFMESDIESLIAAGFLIQKYNRVIEYHITRAAAKYLKLIGQL